MRFSIRDLLWATLVVAMGLGWWTEHATTAERHAKFRHDHARFMALLRAEANSLHATVWAESDRAFFNHYLKTMGAEPLVEP